MSHLQENPYRPPEHSSDTTTHAQTYFPSRILKFWGMVFALPVLLPAIILVIYYPIVSSAQKTSGALIAMSLSFLSVSFGIYLSSLSLNWKHPAKKRHMPIFALVYSTAWIILFKSMFLITNLILTPRFTIPSLAYFLISDSLTLIIFFFYAMLLIWTIQWRVKAHGL